MTKICPEFARGGQQNKIKFRRIKSGWQWQYTFNDFSIPWFFGDDKAALISLKVDRKKKKLETKPINPRKKKKSTKQTGKRNEKIRDCIRSSCLSTTIIDRVLSF